MKINENLKKEIVGRRDAFTIQGCKTNVRNLKIVQKKLTGLKLFIEHFIVPPKLFDKFRMACRSNDI